MSTKPASTDYLVIFGVGADDKPHAATFPLADEAIVRKAADLMGMQIGRTTDDKGRALVRKLPFGKLFATGKALVPLVRHAVYDDLTKALANLDAPKTTTVDKDKPAVVGNATSSSGTANPPAHDPWADIKVGSVVLCQDDSAEPGWWESVVLAIQPNSDVMVMRWRDYPKLKSFRAKRREVGLLGPAIAAKSGKTGSA
jgi:hypothetical protein